MTTLDRLPIDSDQWRAFVQAQGRATPFHHPAWAMMIAECYRFPAFALVLREQPGGTIIAGTPVLEVQRPFGGRRWSSLPFTDVCRPLVESSDETRFLAALDRARIEAGVRAFELDGPLGGFAAVEAGRRVAHVLALDTDPAVVESRYRSSVRRNVRTARESGLVVRVGRDEPDLTEVFYRLQVLTRRRLGLPPQPRRYFSLLWRRIVETGLGSLVLVDANGSAVAGAVFLQWNGTVIYKYGASDPDAWHLRPNNLLFAEAIADACRARRACLPLRPHGHRGRGSASFQAGVGSSRAAAGDGRPRSGRQPVSRAATRMRIGASPLARLRRSDGR